ncbi:MAG: hypothetical protein QOI74_1606 [Micromonosporaceae bacterium]|nr:hypothetical protein [Micromonosporaceae bacterium]
MLAGLTRQTEPDNPLAVQQLPLDHALVQPADNRRQLAVVIDLGHLEAGFAQGNLDELSAAATAVSTSLKMSTSSVGRSTTPWTTRARPPPKAKPWWRATDRAIRATSACSGSGPPIRRRPAAHAGPGDGPPTPGARRAAGRARSTTGSASPHPANRTAHRCDRLAQHDLVHRTQLPRSAQVDRAVRPPQQPVRQFHHAAGGTTQVRQVVDDHREASRPRLVRRRGMA